MVIWTITTAFSGVYQSLVWLENSSGSGTEQILVHALLMLSVGGIVGNVSTPCLSASVFAVAWIFCVARDDLLATIAALTRKLVKYGTCL